MFTLNCRGSIMAIDRPWIMGIINCTPDSFYAGSRAAGDHLLQTAASMIADGANILDIGGQSTRPGSIPVSAGEEMKRVLPAIEALRKTYPDQLISIDTYHGEVARAAISAGADIINDVSAGSIDPSILDVAATSTAPYVLMHMKGAPQTMQQQASYEDVTTEVFDFLNAKMTALRARGIQDLIIDPGFGFGKTIAHNYQLLQHLQLFTLLPAPLMVGLSRKSMISKKLAVAPEEALNGTTVLHTLALQRGARILRVHDVKEAAQAVNLLEV